MAIYVNRIGDSDECEIWLQWSGGDQYSQWQFGEIIVSNGNILFPEYYGKIGYNFIQSDCSTSGFVLLGTVSIPKNVDTVKVKVKNLYGYNMSKGWQSAYMVPLRTKIK